MTKDEVMKLAMEHQVDGCLSHNLRILTFANAIEQVQREKDAKICESDIINCWSADAQVSAYHLAEAIRAKGCPK